MNSLYSRSFSHSFRRIVTKLFFLTISVFYFSVSSFATDVVSVTGTNPVPNALSVAVNSTIQISFSGPVNTDSFNDTASFIVTGENSGRHRGTFAFTSGNTVATFTPTKAFTNGERVIVNISSALQDTSLTAVTPYIYSFSVKTVLSPGTFSDGGNYSTTVTPVSVASIDIDGDELDDVVYLEADNSTVTILKNMGDGTFSSLTQFSVEPTPSSITTGDLDGDGDADIISQNQSDHITIYKNDGIGTFDTGTNYTTSFGSIKSVIYDFDGDGDNDIAVCNFSAMNISILKNTGNAGFGEATNYNITGLAFDLTVGDLDGDGDGDLAILGAKSSNVSILKNNGDATFFLLTDFFLGVEPHSLSLSDLDGDGNVDIAIGTSDGISILKNLDDGSFAAPIQYNEGSNVVALRINDVDGDGDRDIVFSDYTSGNVGVLRNDSATVFSQHGEYPVPGGVTVLTMNDINNDGVSDIIGGSSFPGIYILRGNKFSLTITSPHGTVTKTPDKSEYEYGDTVSLSATADHGFHFISWSGDITTTANPITIVMNANKTYTANYGFDVATVSPAINSYGNSLSTPITITFGGTMNAETFNDVGTFVVSGAVSGKHSGTITFSDDHSVATFTPSAPFFYGEIVTVNLTRYLEDINDNDITPFAYSFSIKNNEASGTFSAKVNYPVGTAPASMAAYDVDKDGDVDIVTANYSVSTISVLKNNGDGTFAEKTDYPTANPPPTSVFAYDLDGDGDGDIIVGYYDNLFSVFMNQGNGTFAAKVDYNFGGNPGVITVNDVNADGYGDVVIATGSNNTVSVLLNDGDGEFSSKTDYATGSRPSAVFISDINNDGYPDIVTTNYNSNTVSVLKNNGNGTFAEKVDYNVATTPAALFVRDIDGDGDVDIVTANTNSGSLSLPMNKDNTSNLPAPDPGTISILKNNGDGTFETRTDYTAGIQPLGVSINDVDGDNDGDVVVSNAFSNTVSLFRNNGNGTFQEKVDYQGGSYPTPIFVGDISGDGIADIVEANQTYLDISVLKGKGFSITVDSTIGSVTVNPLQGEYSGGASITVTATAPTGYKFVRWAGTNPATSNPFTFQIHANTSLTAIFGDSITSISPAKNARNIASTSTIEVSFAIPVLPETINDTASFTVSGKSSGSHRGTIGFTNGNKTITFTPTLPFMSGEQVTVNLSTKILDTANHAIAPLVYKFTGKTNKKAALFGSRIDISYGSDQVTSVVLCDIDGDGDGDMISSASNYLYVSKNNGNGTFADKTLISSSVGTKSLSLSDLDGDGDPDIAAPYSFSTGIRIYTNNGSGTFTYIGTCETGMFPTSVVTKDFNADGYNDIAVVSGTYDYSYLSILINNGNATFQNAGVHPFPYGSSSLALAADDVDNDGDIDVAVMNTFYQGVSIYKNNGIGTFTLYGSYGTLYPASISLGDVDNDGDNDIAVSSSLTNNVTILKNDGNGAFGIKANYATGGVQPNSIAMSDVNADGYQDVVTANFASNNISYLKNNGNGTLAAAVTFAVPSTPQCIFASDIDGDGDGDLLIGTQQSHAITILKGMLFSLTVNGENGSVSKNPDYSEYDDTARVTLTASPNAGFNFVNWTGDTTASVNPVTISMNANKTVTANFIRAFSITVNAIHGRVSTNPDKSLFDSNSVVQLTPVPDTGYRFIGWSNNPADTVVPKSITMDTSKIIDAYFIRQFSLTINATHGTVIKNPAKSFYDTATVVQLTPVPDTNYTFTGWSDNPADTVVPKSVTMDMDKTITANFRLKQYSLTVNASHGTVAKNPAQDTYSHGDNVILTATPNKGYHFTQWSGDLTGTENPDTITMITARTVTAGFARSAPSSVNLISPVHNEIDTLATDTLHINFAWSRSHDEDYHDTLMYFLHLHIVGNIIDTAFTLPYQDTSALFAAVLPLPPTLNYSCFWTVGVSDGIDTVASQDTFAIRWYKPNAVDDEAGLPLTFQLQQNYPNPFNPVTMISYSLPNEVFVSLKVLNLLGQEVATLVNEIQHAGYKSIEFNSYNLPSGIYLYKLQAGNFTDMKKMILMK